ncbi:serine hydroxymethyltransferase 4 [Cinnamomum micranthum f. kanehirae]|uniref:Serine hydroxymethyltransferase 4 n=1 Tax=Cinnamomum micranthum f. kanehirae TaxID=337451 RepID=A0A443N694_9MAGN|nr:serine hydroxymethyltransferase 4 [Cinnamomum micranthum f. kanehirae]
MRDISHLFPFCSFPSSFSSTPWIQSMCGGNTPLKSADDEIFDLIEKEKRCQCHGIELIASENFTSFAIIEALDSPLTNKYSKGMLNNRYYSCNEFINQIENL